MCGDWATGHIGSYGHGARPRANRAVTIATGAYAQRKYELRLPDSWVGEVVIDFHDLSPARLVLHIQNPPPTVATAEPPKGRFVHWLMGGEHADEKGRYDPGEFFKEHIFGYEPSISSLAPRPMPNSSSASNTGC